jgi:cytochrome P450
MKRDRLSTRFDGSDEALRADPYPVYAASRASDGLMRLGPGQWGVTRHADVSQLLDAEGVSSAVGPTHLALSHGNDRVAAFLSRIVLYADPPRHAALRRVLSPATSVAAISRVVAEMPDICSASFAPLGRGGPFDIPRDVAAPVSASVLCRLLRMRGCLAGDIPEASRAVGAVFATRTEEQALARAAAAVERLGEAALRLQLQSEVLTKIVGRAVREGVDRPTLSDNLAFFLFAAFETTAAMIGNAVAWLLADPARQSALRAGKVEAIVASALRDDPPIQGVARVLERDSAVCGKPLRADRLLVLFLASANRDGEPALSFGAGRHRCPGENLARAELRAVLGWIGGAEQPLVAAGTAQRDSESFVRRFETLPVRFGGGGPAS